MVGKGSKLCILHNGCLNMAYDVNLIVEALRRKGYDIVPDPEDSEEIILAGCGSRSAWVDEVINIARESARNNRNKKIIISGCVSRIDQDTVRRELRHYNITIMDFNELMGAFGLQSLHCVDWDFSQNENTDFTSRSSLHKRSQEKMRVIDELRKLDKEFGTSLATYYAQTTRGFVFYHEPSSMEYVTISRGCTYSCSYCAIPRARGPYESVPKDQIIHKASMAVRMGRKRIMLIGDEAGNYGIDTGDCSLVNLMDSILDLNPEVAIGIRFIEPSPFLDYFKAIREHCTRNRMFLLHVPLQSGSQRILRLMNRDYDVSEVRNRLVDIKNNSNTILYSNFIVGFPSETVSDFQETLKMIQDLDVHVNTVIPFSERPGTPALSMNGKVTPDEKLRRCQMAIELLSKMKVNRFEGLLRFLPKERRTQILTLIENAEKYLPRL